MPTETGSAVGAPTDANVKQAVPFYWVHDIERSLRFYVDGLGCRMTNQWLHEGKTRWCWLELGDAAIMLQEFWKEGHHRNVSQDRLGIGATVNFICRDAVAYYRELKSRGLEARKPFVGNGMWVTQVADPDGYELFFESPTDAPEESELPEDEMS